MKVLWQQVSLALRELLLSNSLKIKTNLLSRVSHQFGRNPRILSLIACFLTLMHKVIHRNSG